MSNTSTNLEHPMKTGNKTKLPPFPARLLAGALAVKEMNALMAVHSDGPGQAATFTLELPARAGRGLGLRCFMP